MSQHLPRRVFLTSSAATTAGTAWGQAAAADASRPAGVGDLREGASGPDPDAVDLIVNGTPRTINLEARKTLARALRGRSHSPVPGRRGNVVPQYGYRAVPPASASPPPPPPPPPSR